MASTSFLSQSSLFISTPKFSAAQSQAPPPPSSVAFRQSQRISASYSATAERPPTTTISHTFSSAYEVLGIEIGATYQEIKSAYRRLARISHPDVVASENDSSSSAAADEFIKINDAYTTLSDPGKRADYDKSLFRRERRMASTAVRAATSSRYSGYSTGRNWETDQCW